MKNTAIILILLIFGLVTANCGGKTDQPETKKPTNVTNTNTAAVSNTDSTLKKNDRDDATANNSVNSDTKKKDSDDNRKSTSNTAKTPKKGDDDKGKKETNDDDDR